VDTANASDAGVDHTANAGLTTECRKPLHRGMQRTKLVVDRYSPRAGSAEACYWHRARNADSSVPLAFGPEQEPMPLVHATQAGTQVHTQACKQQDIIRSSIDLNTLNVSGRPRQVGIIDRSIAV